MAEVVKVEVEVEIVSTIGELVTAGDVANVVVEDEDGDEDTSGLMTTAPALG